MNNQPNSEVTTTEILEAINTFATNVEREFVEIKDDIKVIKSDIVDIKSEIATMKSEMGTMKSEMGTMKSEMATKDYIDKIFGTVKGDMVELVRKEDTKVNTIVGELDRNKVLPKESIAKIQSVLVFPYSTEA
ncbi:hypothetical protein HZA86_03920 [Candidatus Uhrbacteria bacterium]|nr:hypothetical protein [Candidatus Uhrbacteria bacterium]